MRRITVGLVLLSMALVPAGVADAAKRHKSKKKTVSFTLTGNSQSINGAHFAGDLAGPFGAGATVYDVTTGSSPASLNVTFTAFFAAGSVKGTAVVTTPPKDPNIAFAQTGTGTVTSGTGKFKGAKGSFTINATQANSTSPLALKFVGKLTY